MEGTGRFQCGKQERDHNEGINSIYRSIIVYYFIINFVILAFKKVVNTMVKMNLHTAMFLNTLNFPLGSRLRNLVKGLIELCREYM